MVATSHSTTPKDHLKRNYMVLKKKGIWVKRKILLYMLLSIFYLQF